MAQYRVRSPNSLLSISINLLTKHLETIIHLPSIKELEDLEQLPVSIKNQVLEKILKNTRYPEEILTRLICRNTVHIDLTSNVVNNNILNILKKGQYLKRLELKGKLEDSITSECLGETLKHLECLQILNVSNIEVMCDEVMQILIDYCPNLFSIDVGDCKNISDDGFSKLCKLNHLTFVRFSNTNISDDGLTNFLMGNSGEIIKELRIDGCANVTEIGLNAILNSCPNILYFMFNNCKINHNSVFLFDNDRFKNFKQIAYTISM